MLFSCPYSLLNLKNDPNISNKQIKAAWRILSEKYHPDTGGENADSEKFNQIQWAYKFLTNAYKRNDYHKTGKIEKDNEAVIDQAARENLIILLKNTIHSNSKFYLNYKKSDLFNIMRDTIISKKTEIESEIEDYIELISKLKEIKNRVISKNASLIPDALETEIIEAKSLSEKKKLEIKTFEKMGSLLEDYTYRTDTLNWQNEV